MGLMLSLGDVETSPPLHHVVWHMDRPREDLGQDVAKSLTPKHCITKSPTLSNLYKLVIKYYQEHTGGGV